ncbi:MAG: class I SAM-dependent methyltransferase, partial [Chloroflexi bacterium]|nr:class I SAM-dependent methyltransferase [Chloroflexota bacterium]
MPALILKPGREKSLLRRHPWVFSGAVERVDGNPAPGGTVDLLSSKGDFLARAAYSPISQIRARVWTFDPSDPVDADFFRRKILRATKSRSPLLLGEGPGVRSAACRLIYAESDSLPGLIVDRYADVLVAQFLSAGAETWKETIADILLEETGLTALYERSDADVRELEGLAPRVGLLRGTIDHHPLTITESNLQFKVALARGHKTGFYLDQRENRRKVRGLARGREVLDCFCYTGGFTVNALAGGAKS